MLNTIYKGRTILEIIRKGKKKKNKLWHWLLAHDTLKDTIEGMVEEKRKGRSWMLILDSINEANSFAKIKRKI